MYINIPGIRGTGSDHGQASDGVPARLVQEAGAHEQRQQRVARRLAQQHARRAQRQARRPHRHRAE